MVTHIAESASTHLSLSRSRLSPSHLPSGLKRNSIRRPMWLSVRGWLVNSWETLRKVAAVVVGVRLATLAC